MHSTQTIAVIPARAGSKGIPNKNILKIRQKTLIEIAIQQAKRIKKIDQIIFSSDSSRYCRIAEKVGANVLGKRPSELSKDTTKTVEVLFDIVKYFSKLDTILLLQPTAPVRSVKDIEKALDFSIKNNKTVISMSKVEEPHPTKMFLIRNSNNELRPFVESNKFNAEMPRQKLPPVYMLNGAFYCINVKEMLKNKKIISNNSVAQITKMYPNIDTLDDFHYINWMIESGKELPEDFLRIIS
tara:strand:- start:27792 stop:28514 length:723 start_codon:yes stop_codon:yes gene_type:complete